MKTVCKFKVETVTEFATYDKGKRYQQLKLAAVYDDGNKENKSFAEATPSGTLEFAVTNQEVIDQYKAGDFVYVTIKHADQ